MNKLGFLAYAAQVGPRILQVRRRTWISLGIGFLALVGLFIWAAVALTGWALGQTQGWLGNFKTSASGPAREILVQMEQVAPGVVATMREKLVEYVPALRTETVSHLDVSGSDLGPVPRYPGMVRSYWHREGRAVAVEYEARVDFGAVLEHYAQGFAAADFAAEVQFASREMEVHQYTQAQERYLVRFSRKPGGIVSVHLETTLGAATDRRATP